MCRVTRHYYLQMTFAMPPSRSEPGSAPATAALARALWRRDIASRFLTALPVSLTCSTLVWTSAVALCRWANSPMPQWAFAGFLGGMSLFAAAYYGWSRARTELTLLMHADQTLRLNSALSNAWQLRSESSPFAQVAVQSGEAEARTLHSPDRAKVVPLRFGSAMRSVVSIGVCSM